MSDFIAYQCDERGYYVGETLCQRNPKTNTPMLPQYATFVKPIEAEDGSVLWFDFCKDEWWSFKITPETVNRISQVKEILDDPSKENIKKAISVLMELL